MKKMPDKKTASDGARLRKMFVAGALVVLGIAAALGGWSLYASSAEREIRALLDRRAEALHDKDLARYLSCFSPDYQGDAQTYAQLQATMLKTFSNFAAIQFTFEILDLHIREKKALVEDKYTFRLTPATGEPIIISKREVLEIRQEQGEWKIFRVRAVQ
jgi:ketosteroid isomerase-like protein